MTDEVEDRGTEGDDNPFHPPYVIFEPKHGQPSQWPGSAALPSPPTDAELELICRMYEWLVRTKGHEFN